MVMKKVTEEWETITEQVAYWTIFPEQEDTYNLQGKDPSTQAAGHSPIKSHRHILGGIDEHTLKKYGHYKQSFRHEVL